MQKQSRSPKKENNLLTSQRLSLRQTARWQFTRFRSANTDLRAFFQVRHAKFDPCSLAVRPGLLVPAVSQPVPHDVFGHGIRVPTTAP